mgnify:CR=1 FL=1
MEISETCVKGKKISNGSEPWMGAGRKKKTCGGEWSSSKQKQPELIFGMKQPS